MKKMKSLLALMLSFALLTGCLSGGRIAEAKKDKSVKGLKVTNVKGKKLIIKKGKKFRLKTKLILKKGSKANRGLIFKSSKKAVAAVNTKGVIRAKNLGKAKITVISKANKGKKAVITVTVKSKVSKVKKITLNRKKLTLYINSEEDDDEEYTDEEDSEYEDADDESDDTEDDFDDESDELGEDAYELIATIAPRSAMAAELSWSSSDENVVSVDDDGYVLGIDAGTATITVKAKDGSKKKAKCKVTVIDRSGDDDEEYDEDEDEE